MQHIIHLRQFLLSSILVLAMLFLISCDTQYYTPREAVEAGYLEGSSTAKYELVDKEIAIIEQKNYALYLYESNDIILLSYLEVDDSGIRRKYISRALQYYYSIKDINGKITETVLLDGNHVFSTLSTKIDKKAYKGYDVKSYDITAFGTTKTYYLVYK